jgi:hypothetical protein
MLRMYSARNVEYTDDLQLSRLGCARYTEYPDMHAATKALPEDSATSRMNSVVIAPDRVGVLAESGPRHEFKNIVILRLKV